MQRYLLMSLLCFASGSALAHTGHTVDGFTSGLFHPVSGLDHLLAMLTVGLWSAAVLPQRWWIAPLTFMLAMLAGAVLGISGITLPLLEPSIALSVVVFGLLVVSFAQLGTLPALFLIALFALFHGNAHGAEAPVGGSVAAYLMGFLLSTGALHLLGVALGTTLVRTAQTGLLRIVGGGISALGLWLLFAS